MKYDGTKLQQFPLPVGPPPLELARTLGRLAAQRAAGLPSALAARPARALLDTERVEAERILAEMVAVQEELDWECLHLYGLTADSLTAPEDREAPPSRPRVSSSPPSSCADSWPARMRRLPGSCSTSASPARSMSWLSSWRLTHPSGPTSRLRIIRRLAPKPDVEAAVSRLERRE